VRNPVPFDPDLSSATPGFEDPTPSFQPTCTEDPPVGRLQLARRSLRAHAGQPVTVELRWRHPDRWRSLHEVAVQLTGRRGVLATLRFDQDSGMLTLARGPGRRGRSLPTGRAGTLRAGRVRVRLAKNRGGGVGPDRPRRAAALQGDPAALGRPAGRHLGRRLRRCRPAAARGGRRPDPAALSVPLFVLTHRHEGTGCGAAFADATFTYRSRLAGVKQFANIDEKTVDRNPETDDPRPQLLAVSVPASRAAA